jgi:hypothetical protein
MKAVFEVISTKSSWSPPFNKVRESGIYEVSERESFEAVEANGVKGSVFTVRRLKDNAALIAYDSHFMRKDDANARTKELWAETGSTYEFSFLWGDNGITKRLTLKKVIYDV